MESIAKGLKPVTSANPVAPYIGGKRNLAKRLCARISTIPHTTYAEAFVGMGGVFLRRQYRPKSEVINDYSQDVITLFRILQRQYANFLNTLRFQITSRQEFNRLVDTRPDTLLDIERAARFLYLQKTGFGGKVAGQNFGVSVERPGSFNLTRLEPMLEELHERLAGVTIERLPYQDFIPRYDRKTTLFYLDPPYYGCENDYGKDMFSRDDFERLAALLEALKGRFILSLNDVPEVRDIFAGFDIEAIETSYTISAGKSQKMREVIISN